MLKRAVVVLLSPSLAISVLGVYNWVRLLSRNSLGKTQLPIPHSRVAEPRTRTLKIVSLPKDLELCRGEIGFDRGLLFSVSFL